MPSGTPVTMAKPTATLTIDRCSSVRSPIAGRLCRMNASVSTRSPNAATPRHRRRAPVFQKRGGWSITDAPRDAAAVPNGQGIEAPGALFAAYMRFVVPYGAHDLSIAARNRGLTRAFERRKRAWRTQLRASNGIGMHQLPP